jgi:hypothetical protein
MSRPQTESERKMALTLDYLQKTHAKTMALPEILKDKGLDRDTTMEDLQYMQSSQQSADGVPVTAVPGAANSISRRLRTRDDGNGSAAAGGADAAAVAAGSPSPPAAVVPVAEDPAVPIKYASSPTRSFYMFCDLLSYHLACLHSPLLS